MTSFTPATVVPRHRQDGFALVLVIVLLSLMTIIAVGFLSSMSSERATASAFSNKNRAEQMAQAGAESAMGVLRDYFKAFPDSATAWDAVQSTNTDLTTNGGTTLYLRAVPSQADSTLPDPAPDISDPNYANADFTGGNGPNNVNATTGIDNRKIFVLPLVSGATVKPLVNKASALPTPIADNSVTANAVNLNSRRQVSDTQGWIGSPPTPLGAPTPSPSATPMPIDVPWVEIKQQDGYSDPTKAPVVGRYAYWVEDESFRANISYAGLGTTVTSSGNNYSHQRRDNAQNFALNPTDADLLGPLDLIATPSPSPDPNIPLAQSIFGTRAYYPGNVFPELRAFAHAPGLSTTIIDGLRYLTTVHSAALNLTRHGTQRLSLNDAVNPATLPTDTNTIQKEVDKIVTTLQFHAPNLGQRLYRIAPVPTASKPTISVTDPTVLNAMSVTHDSTSAAETGNYAKLYYYKIAANIRDYMDNDSFPTCIREPTDSDARKNGVVQPAGAPAIPLGDNGDTTVWALGKDAAPFMQECAARFRRTDGGTGTPFTMAIDYYIEFWNMSTKDVKSTDLGTNPFIRVSNPTRWEVNNSVKYTPTGNPTPTPAPAFSTGADLISDDADGVSPSNTRPTIPKRDYKIDLSKGVANGIPVNPVIFYAGQVTVITTDTSYTDVIKDTEALKHVVVCPWITPGKSIYKGEFPAGRPAAGKDVLNMVFETVPSYPNGSTSSSDFETDITIGSDWGYIDCLQGALPLSWGGNISVPYTGSSTNFPYLFGGVMRGNWTNTSSRATQGLESSALGDPRTTNEQLVYTLNPLSTDLNPSTDRSRYAPYDVFNPSGSTLGSSGLNPVPGNPDTGVVQTFGQPNYRSVRPNRPENPWGDMPPYYAIPDNNPATAELVLTADKAPMPIANSALTSIGQLGDVFDPSRMIDYSTVGGSRGGGRSLKIGQHDDRWDGDEGSASRTWAAWRLADIFATTNTMQQPGLININGVTRDNGDALRAALTGFRFQPDPASIPLGPLGDPTLADSSSPSVASRFQVDQLIAEIKSRLNQSSLSSGGAANTGTLQTGAGPFWERGELSELPGFGRSPDQIKPTTASPNFTTYPVTDLTGLDMSSKVFDHGREELFRRLVEMTTTRGSVFTVYVLGQAINQTNPTDPKTKRITGTHQLKVTFRLVPRNKADSNGITTDFHPATDTNNVPLDFDPNNPAAVEARFAKPDHYEAQILAVSSSNS